jgi:hypothetical protein
MTAQELRKVLEARGLVILHVGVDSADPEVLVVYLHGNAGQWWDGYARNLIRAVDEVVSVKDSQESRTILLVRMSSEPVEPKRWAR